MSRDRPIGQQGHRAEGPAGRGCSGASAVSSRRKAAIGPVHHRPIGSWFNAVQLRQRGILYGCVREMEMERQTDRQRKDSGTVEDRYKGKTACTSQSKALLDAD